MQHDRNMSASHRTRFRNSRERATWLAALAASAAAVWAIAQILHSPVAVRAVLAALAALVTVLIPELRARRARADVREQLLGLLEVHGNRLELPEVRDVTIAELRVHPARAVVPYVTRDAEMVVEAAILDRHPFLLVGHSMAGKTRLAAECLSRLLPNAIFLAPHPGSALGKLVFDANLDVAGVVIWLDDLERFLRGDEALDIGLLERMLHGGAIVVSTMRLSEFDKYRPHSEVRPPEWDVIRRFERITLPRRNSLEEGKRIRVAIKDSAVLEGADRYGLAEYLGAGPDAIQRYDDGETICPVGQALVHAAVDWRRAGLGEHIPVSELRKALSIYLEQRPDILDDATSIKEGLVWATERINETVALLLPYYHSDGGRSKVADELYEVFDYLVDVISDRKVPISAKMWHRVGQAAGADAQEVARVAGFYFAKRSGVMAEIISWLADTVVTGAKLLALTGGPGTGKTAVLTMLELLADPSTQNLIPADPGRPKVRLPAIDLQVKGRGLTSRKLLQELCSAAGCDTSNNTSTGDTVSMLRIAIKSRPRPFLAVIDAIDEASEPDGIVQLISLLMTASDDVPLRLIVSTRPNLIAKFHVIDLKTINLSEARFQSIEDIADAIRQRLSAPGSPYENQPIDLVDRVAQAIAAQSSGSFLVARYTAENIILSGLAIDVDGMVIPSLATAIESGLAQLGPDEPLARRLLRALAMGTGVGYDLSEWSAAVSEDGQLVGFAEIERLLPRLMLVLITIPDEPASGDVRYQFAHAEIRDYFMTH